MFLYAVLLSLCRFQLIKASPELLVLRLVLHVPANVFSGDSNALKLAVKSLQCLQMTKQDCLCLSVPDGWQLFPML